MTWTTPRTWVAGEKPSAATWNTHLRDNLSHLANKATCRAYRSAVQSAGNNATTVVTFDQERWDTATMHDTSTNNDRITVPAGWGGLYIVTFSFELAAAADYTHVRGGIRLNGSSILAYTNTGSLIDNTASPSVTVTTHWKANVGDYFQALVFQENAAAAARNILSTANLSPEFMATWVGL